MSASRREFIQRAVAAGGALSLGLGSELIAQPGPSARALRILILGGTSFLGPHLVRYAFERGHSVSIFNRGRTVPRLHAELFDRVEHLEGDREGDLKSIETGTWDAVIDNSGQRVEWARDAAQLLKDRVRYYLYVSSTGVYLPYRTADIREDTPLVLAAAERRDHRPTHLHRRPGRHDGSVPLLAGPDRAGWRRPGARPQERSGPAHRCA